MAEKKAKDIADATIKEEETTTTGAKVTAAKEANAQAAKAVKDAAKASAEATAAVAADTAKKTKKVAKEAAKKSEETAKKAAKKAASTTKSAAEKVKETTESTKKYARKPKRNVCVQYMGKEYSEDELIDRALAQFAALEGSVSVKKISLYIKPEEMAAYYVINEQYTGCVDL